MKRITRVAVVAVAALALLAGGGPASAHVRGGYQTNKIVKIKFRVPVEGVEENPARQGNEKFRVVFPEGFKIKTCYNNSDFKCKKHGLELTWTRRKHADFYDTVDFFVVKVKTPKYNGNYVVPAYQTYDDGETDAWDQPPVSGQPEPPRPAVTIRVVGDPAPAV